MRQLGFTYSTCRPFTKYKEIIQKFKETIEIHEIHARYSYQKEIDKACFQYDMANGDFKDLPRRKALGKILRDKAFNFAKKSKI